MHRVLIISHAYLSAANRGKLRALASRGVDVTVGVPQRWRDPVLGATLEIAWERQNGVEVFPIPARHHGEADALKYGGRALQALAENRSHRWHLTVVGDGPDRERLERLASDLRLAARIRWAGALPPEDVRKLWPELDVLVLPARPLPTWAEPAAHVAAEAMA